jgi:uridine kinase
MTIHKRVMRNTLIQSIAKQILELPSNGIIKVAIDGVDGAGKTVFADELATAISRISKRPIIRASVDGFHHPREVRYRLGRDSSEGFFYDSYDYEGLKHALLNPLSPGGSRSYRRAIFDHHTDSKTDFPFETAEEGSILIFDGIFLHRNELASYWDFSLFLDVDFSVSIPRGAQRGPSYGSPDPHAPSNQRYIDGQKFYLSLCSPKERATITLDHHEIHSPFILSRSIAHLLTAPEFLDFRLSTPRLELEPVTETHASEFHELLQDPDLHRYVPFESPTLQQQQERCARWIRRKSRDSKELWLNWAARCKECGKIIAHFQVSATSDRKASLGYIVARSH